MTTNGGRGSPSRRKSIAVAIQNRPLHPGKKRRAHSIAPGDKINLASKARRSLAPRKSILKPAVNIPEDDDDATQSMDLTHVHENTRKSLARRVSFADRAHVRLFETQEQNTNSTISPQSSPLQEAVERGPTDENAYPGASNFRRRSSIRSVAFSDGAGEESMDMDSDDTAFGPAAYLRAHNEEAVVDEDFPDDDFDLDDDDMEVTEAMHINIQKRRSLALPPSRQPLANVTSPPDNHDEGGQQHAPAEQSYTEDDSHQSQSFVSEGDVSQPMEFTVPLIRPPAPPSEAWLALRSITHSGETPYVPSSDEEDEHGGQDMEITDALTRLQAARESLGFGNGIDVEEFEQQNNSFNSSEDSFAQDDVENDGNHTINVTQLMRRVSLGAGNGDGNSTMEITSTYGSQEEPSGDQSDVAGIDLSSSSVQPIAEAHGNVAQTEPQECVHEELAARPAVFKPAPPPGEISNAMPPTPIPRPTTVPKPFSFSFTPRAQTPVSPARPRPPSPTKSVSPSKAKFSAAFAPPVARSSPKKRVQSVLGDSESEDRPSPAKKLAGPGKLTAPLNEFSKEPPMQSSRLPRLSPSKKTSFQAHAEPVSGPTKRPSVGFRRPSGYFAQRKSMSGAALAASPAPVSPAKKAAAHIGRKSTSFADDGDAEPLTRFAGEKEGAVGETAEKAVLESQEMVRAETNDFPMREPPVHEMLGRASPPVDLLRKSPARESPVLPFLRSQSPSRNSPRPPTPVHASPRLPSPGPELEPEDLPEPDFEGMEGISNPTPLAFIPEGISNPTEQWRGDIAEGDFPPEDGPQVSIDQFFEMTGIRFMDEIAAPRRSTVHSSALRPSRRQSTENEIPLSEYVVAMAVDVPQLELYTHVSKDLQLWIERIKGIYKDAEEEALKMTPELFQEFVLADEEGQNELLHQLKLIKVNKHAQAKSEWYDWKMQWVEQLYEKADQGFRDLEADAKVLEDIIRQTQEVVPVLNEEYENLLRELEQEQADVAELENCDQDYLNELKTTIQEQSVALEAFRADVDEGKAKLERLQEKLEEIEAQKLETTNAIQVAERQVQVQKNSTHVEVFRLKDELEALQNLHMLQVTKVLPELFEFRYASSYDVSVPCKNFCPVVKEVSITRVQSAKLKYKDAFPALSPLILKTANSLITRSNGDLSVRQIVERLGDYWSACSQLLAQLKLVAIKYPVAINHGADDESGFTATITVMLPSKKAKALISFIFDTRTFSSWPISIQSMQCDVKVAYGPIQRDTLHEAILSRLREATVADNYGCLLDACTVALDCYA
ncbi:Spc7 kinetochore protein-domain-containing protein [Suillus clintonianus]|uniref:Spc7 kinetochore protein-domain-containing protein n=1 Tax=Suillus clintonianus TaxID=1904413 RepID=UPI001B85FBF2|nr:Spc7 kinetochore protein-domain-containing protein [Suillus clintonianus]KAG2155502.1 Spc7 kinetochore protein-domain-containing protein [Suillus clintonianus]